MKKLLTIFLAMLICIATLSVPSFAYDDTYYFTDRNNNEMMAPAKAFATEVIEFNPGTPWTKDDNADDVECILGLPDWNGKYKGDSRGGVTIGSGGSLVLKFDIAIYDGEGLDIYVFEIGEEVEATQVEVSRDLNEWYNVGIAKGKTAGVDLNGKIPEGMRFRYVRLTDMKTTTGGTWPGADIDAVSGLNVKAATSDWSQDEIDKAYDIELIPEILKNTDLTKNITRAEFAAVSVKAYEKISGKTAVPALNNPFVDCDDIEVLKAYNLGITSGVSATIFEPETLLNREQAATMLTRVFKKATMQDWTLAADEQFELVYKKVEEFSDDANISEWAKDSVYFMAANEIINGVGNNKFAPKNVTTEEQAQGYANATREQALLIAVRMVENLK